MAEKTPRMRQIEEMLAAEPGDAFLRYALAMEYVGAGDDETALLHLRGLIAREPYVPAYLQAGQALIRLDRLGEAREVLREGIAQAARQGDAHAEGEMRGFLESIE
ncbi:MAG TPA: tetratricopeptide repeat protein [Gemmataceae bacterium]